MTKKLVGVEKTTIDFAGIECFLMPLFGLTTPQKMMVYSHEDYFEITFRHLKRGKGK